MSERTIVAVVADTHCGSQVGLMPPDQFQLDAEGFYDPSPQQKFLWQCWEESWLKIAKLRKRAKLIIVFNGDAIQGTDEKFMALVSKRTDEHDAIHVDCMEYAFRTAGFNQSKGDELYYVRGTERHSEAGSAAEERIASDLGANELAGRSSNIQIQLKVNGVVFDFMHKRIKRGTRWWTQDNALFYAAKDTYARIIDNDWFKPPFEAIYVGSHFHSWLPHQTHRGPKGNVTFAITPAFQLMTGYAIEVTKGLERATVGMMAYEVEGDGAWRVHEYIWEPNHIPVPSK